MNSTYSIPLKRDPLTVRLLTRCGLAGALFLAVLSYNAGKPAHSAVWVTLAAAVTVSIMWTERRWFGHLHGGLIP